MLKYESTTDLMNSTLEAMGQVFTCPLEIEKPTIFQKPLLQSEIGVLIGIVGDVEGRLIIEGNMQTFGNLGFSMFGMPLEGEMLHSFVGEMANMIAGNTSTIYSSKGRHIDITPPTVMVGQLQLYGFESGISVNVHLDQIGTVSLVLLLQEKRGA